VLSSLPPRAAEAGRGIRKSFDSVFAGVSARGRNQSTIFNPEPPRTAEGNYAAFWENTLNKQASAAAARGMEKRKRHEQEVADYQARLEAKEKGRNQYLEDEKARKAEMVSAAVERGMEKRKMREQALAEYRTKLEEKVERRKQALADESVRKADRALQRARDAANPFLSNNAPSGRAGTAGSGSGGAGGLMAGLANRFLGVGAAIGGIYSAGRFTVESVMADISMRRIRNTLEAVHRDSQKAADDFEFLKNESNRIGFSLTGTADAFARYTVAAKAANLTSEQTRSIFTAMQEAAAVMGLSQERTAEAMLAVEQMLGKGTVMAQELRIQLGNAMPGAMDIFARALKVSQKELYAMIEAGQLASREVLPKFAEELRRSFILTDEANTTLRDINRLSNSWLEFKATVGEGLRPATEKSLNAFSAIIQGLNALLSGKISEGPIAEMLVPGVHELRMEEASQKGRIAAMQKTYEYAKQFKDELAKAVKLVPRPINITIDPKVIADMIEEANRLRITNTRREEKLRLDKLTPEQRKAELNTMLADANENLAKVKDRLKQHSGDANLQLNVELWRERINDLNAELMAIREEAPAKTKTGGFSLGNLSQQRAGSFVGGPAVAQLEVSKDQLRELRELNRKLAQRNPFREEHY
jgi:tape measure domain-containing protein